MNTLRKILSALALAGAASVAQAAPQLTVYQDFAVIRDHTTFTVRTGTNDIVYRDITRALEPSSVMLRPDDTRWQLTIREQSYQGAPLSEERLLQAYEGQTLDFLVRFNDHESIMAGKILRAPGPSASASLSPIIRMNGKLRFDLPGRPLFPEQAGDGLLKPELRWKVDSSRSGEVAVTISYLTGGFGWDAAYNFIQRDDQRMDASGWLTVRNDSGTDFDAIQARLVAGNVHRTQPPGYQPAIMKEMRMADAAPPVTEKAVDEFHLYQIPGTLALRNGETKQVEFIRGENIRYQTELVYDGANLPPQINTEYVRTQGNFGTQGHHQVQIFKVFENTLKNGLGKPLPAGKARFYQQDESGLVFVGENHLAHTPRNETIRLYTGTAFDVTGERKQTEFSVFSAQRQVRETIQITLKNRKPEAVTVQVVEHLFRGARYELISPLRWQKVDAQTITLPVSLPPDTEQQVQYTVNYRW